MKIVEDRNYGTYLLGGIAGSDLMVRLVPELLGLGDNVVVPVGAIVVTQLVLDWSYLGWLLSWLLLAVVLFQLAPITFPQDEREWAHGLPGRTCFALSGVVLGLFFEKLMLEWTGIGRSPFQYGVEYAPVAVVGILLLLFVSRILPPMRLGGSLVYEFDGRDYPVESTAGMGFLGPYLLLVAVVGLMLAEISLLFPIPELLILGVSLHDVFGYQLRSVPQIPARRDLAERVVLGSAAIWSGLRSSFLLLYLVAGLLTIILLDMLYINATHLWKLPGVRPLNFAFAVFTLGGATVFGTVHIVRLIERIPLLISGGDSHHAIQFYDRDYLRRRVHGVVRPFHLVKFYDEEDLHSTADVMEPKPRIPGLMIPAGFLFGSLTLALPSTEWRSFENTAPLEVTGPIVGLALVAAAIGTISVLRPGRVPDLQISDYYAGPVSIALFLIFAIGLDDNLVILSRDPRAVFLQLVSNVGVFFIFMSPFLGFELFTGSTYIGGTRERIGSNLVDGIKFATVLLLLYFFGTAIAMLIYRETSLSFSPWIIILIQNIGVIPAVILFAAIGVRLLFLPFYFADI